MRFRNAISLAALSAAAISTTSVAKASQGTDPAKATAGASAPAIDSPSTVAPARLPAGTPVIVMLNDELSTKASKAGDTFHVTVLHDVVEGGTVVIPKGTIGHGEVTFATNNGGFGKPGILSISLRHLELNGTKVLLDGRYREEGANKNGATAATWFAVGVFSGFIKGKPGVIPKGRELKARTGEDIAIAPRPPANGAAQATPPNISIDPKTGGSE